MALSPPHFILQRKREPCPNLPRRRRRPSELLHKPGSIRRIFLCWHSERTSTGRRRHPPLFDARVASTFARRKSLCLSHFRLHNLARRHRGAHTGPYTDSLLAENHGGGDGTWWVRKLAGTTQAQSRVNTPARSEPLGDGILHGTKEVFDFLERLDLDDDNLKYNDKLILTSVLLKAKELKDSGSGHAPDTRIPCSREAALFQDLPKIWLSTCPESTRSRR
jgi:hypothetical protein